MVCVCIYIYICYCLITKLCWNLCNSVDCRRPGFAVCHYLLSFPKFMSIELVMLSNRLILYHPLLLLPSIFPSIRVFPSELAIHIRWPKYWSFSFSVVCMCTYIYNICKYIYNMCIYDIFIYLKYMYIHTYSLMSLLPSILY